jgi:hypothetical protein
VGLEQKSYCRRDVRTYELIGIDGFENLGVAVSEISRRGLPLYLELFEDDIR